MSARAFILSPGTTRVLDEVLGPVAPVVGCGWLLLVLEVAQCEAERAMVRALYLAIFSLPQSCVRR